MVDGRSGRRNVVVQSVANVGLRGGSVILLFALSIILARVLGATGYGKYSYIIAILTLLSVPAQFGIPVLLLRRVAQYEASKEWPLLRGLLRRCGEILLILTVVTALLAALVYVGFFSPGERSGPGLLLWGLVFMFFLNLGRFCSATLTGFMRPLEGTFPSSIIRPALFIVSLVLLVELFGAQLSPSEAMALNAGATIVAFVVGLVLLVRRLPADAKRISPEYRSREWIFSLIPLALMGGIQIINSQVDVVVLGSLGTKSEVGIYRAALRFSLLAPLINMAILRVIAPHVSRLYARKEGGQLQSMITLAARLMAVIRLPLTVCYLVVPGWLLATAYGGEFGRGADALRILAVGGFFGTIMGATVMIMNMTGREKAAAKVVGIAAVINLILNLVLVPRLGMLGSAIATTCSSFIANVVLVAYIRLRMGLWSLPLGQHWADPDRLFRL